MLVFTLFLFLFVMRHVCLERFRKNGLFEEDSPLMTMVAKLSLSDLELSSLESHSCPI
jgi:hypothetical protein